MGRWGIGSATGDLLLLIAAMEGWSGVAGRIVVRGVTSWGVKVREGPVERAGGCSFGTRGGGRGSNGVGWIRKGRMDESAREDVRRISY